MSKQLNIRGTPAEALETSVSQNYPLGTRLEVEVTIIEPDAQPAPRLDDETAHVLNTFMRGGE